MYFKKLLLTLLLLFTLVTSGCIQKQANGKYYSKYSYHPYYKLYRDKMAGRNKEYKPKYSHHYTKELNSNSHSFRKISQRIKHRIKYNDEDLYPSNVPASSNY